MARVFADTNVLFPFSLMDLIRTLAEDYVHDLVWSDRLLDEWQRVIVREGHRSTEAAELIAGHVRTGFADSCVPEDRYKHLLAELDGPDPDDVHHLAAAIAGHADTLITWNLDDFPAETLGPPRAPGGNTAPNRTPAPAETSSPAMLRRRAPTPDGVPGDQSPARLGPWLAGAVSDVAA